jgi:hypothetical protein
LHIDDGDIRTQLIRHLHGGSGSRSDTAQYVTIFGQGFSQTVSEHHVVFYDQDLHEWPNPLLRALTIMFDMRVVGAHFPKNLAVTSRERAVLTQEWVHHGKLETKTQLIIEFFDVNKLTGCISSGIAHCERGRWPSPAAGRHRRIRIVRLP